MPAQRRPALPRVTRVVDDAAAIVLGMCGHWWQGTDWAQLWATQCPVCGGRPAAVIDCWDEVRPDQNAT